MNTKNIFEISVQEKFTKKIKDLFKEIQIINLNSYYKTHTLILLREYDFTNSNQS